MTEMFAQPRDAETVDTLTEGDWIRLLYAVSMFRANAAFRETIGKVERITRLHLGEHDTHPAVNEVQQAPGAGR